MSEGNKPREEPLDDAEIRTELSFCRTKRSNSEIAQKSQRNSKNEHQDNKKSTLRLTEKLQSMLSTYKSSGQPQSQEHKESP